MLHAPLHDLIALRWVEPGDLAELLAQVPGALVPHPRGYRYAVAVEGDAAHVDLLAQQEHAQLALGQVAQLVTDRLLAAHVIDALGHDFHEVALRYKRLGRLQVKLRVLGDELLVELILGTVTENLREAI